MARALLHVESEEELQLSILGRGSGKDAKRTDVRHFISYITTSPVSMWGKTDAGGKIKRVGEKGNVSFDRWTRQRKAGIPNSRGGKRNLRKEAERAH